MVWGWLSLNKHQREILDYLQANKGRWVNAGELASYAKVTTRAIRSNIAKLKEQYPEMINSGNQGYQLLSIKDESLSDNSLEDRTAQVFLELIKNSKYGIDLYDLAEKLFISESTLKGDIQELRKGLPKDSLKISIRSDKVQLVGGERAKRKYMISLLYDEGDFKEQLKLSVQNMIGYISLNELEALIQNSLKRNGITLNSYSLYNIALHFAVSVERIRQGHTIRGSQQMADITQTQAFRLSNQIADLVSTRYGVIFDGAEREYLALLFIGIQTDTDDKMLGSYVRPEIVKALRDILQNVSQTYHVDLSDRDFLLSFQFMFKVYIIVRNMILMLGIVVFKISSLHIL